MSDHQGHLFDDEPFPPYVRGSETSREAAESVKDVTGHLRLKVLNFIRMQGEQGATCDEVEQGTGLSHQTCSARFKELKDAGAIKHAVVPTIDGWGTVAIKRPTRSGRKAFVFVVRGS